MKLDRGLSELTLRPGIRHSEVDPLFAPPPRAFDLIPEADQKQRCRRRGRWGGLLVRLRRRAHHPPLPSILLAKVHSLGNKVDKIRARVAF